MVPENTSTFYVNDGSTQGDEFTTAVGSNRNSGKLPGAPQALSEQYPANVRARADADALYRFGQLRPGFDVGDLEYPGPGRQRGLHLDWASQCQPHGNVRPCQSNLYLGADRQLSDADFVTLARVSLEGGTNGVLVHNGSRILQVAISAPHTPPRMAFTWR